MKKFIKDNFGWKLEVNGELSTKDLFNHIFQNREFTDTNVALYNLPKLRLLLDRWYQKLPSVKPYYAVKSNPDPEIISKLASLGVGFDCASRKELELAAQHASINFETDVICAQTFKSPGELRAISSLGVKYTTFDCVEELQKIANFGLRNLKLVLRIAGGDEEANQKYNKRFGVLKSEYRTVLECATQLGLCVEGVSFYVGHSVKNTNAYYKAIQKASDVWKIAEEYGFDMKLLDVGGGFVEKYFEDAANDINRGIEEFFGGKNITVIAEPGKYFSASVVSSCFTVVGKRTRTFDGVTQIDYVISDGINGTFCYLPLAEDNEAIPIYLGNIEDPIKFNSAFYGPTCDGDDKITECEFPVIEIGDKIAFDTMGGYTISLATDFNGIQMATHTRLYINEESCSIE